MLESILIIGGVMLLVAILLSPLYFFRKNIISKGGMKISFSPSVPIGRVAFFIGWVFLFVAWIIFNSLFLFKISSFNAAIVYLVLSNFVASLWYAKRFTDIKPEKNAWLLQAGLFVLFILTNIVYSVHGNMINAVKSAILVGDSIHGVFFNLKIISYVYAALTTLIFGLTFYLLFKKGKGQKVKEIKNENV
jgi:hypothetical protein